MINAILTKIFGSRNERELKKLWPKVAEINALEPSIQALSDDQLKAKTAEFKARLAKGATLDDLLPEAFAVVRETSKRVMGMRHFDVQLLGGMVLHNGKIAEMRTGEGKTLVATLPRTSTPSPAAACTSSRSTTTSRAETRSGWGRSTSFSGCPWGWS